MSCQEIQISKVESKLDKAFYRIYRENSHVVHLHVKNCCIYLGFLFLFLLSYFDLMTNESRSKDIRETDSSNCTDVKFGAKTFAQNFFHRISFFVGDLI